MFVSLSGVTDEIINRSMAIRVTCPLFVLYTHQKVGTNNEIVI